MKNTKTYNSIITSLITSLVIFSINTPLALAAPPVLGNLIINPDMQIGSTNAPTNWQLSGFSDTFTGNYPVLGPLTGDKATQITTTVHNAGDAKWVFDNVPVSEGALYTFSDSYQSNVPTALVAAFTTATGTTPTLFTTIATLASSGGAWQTATNTFTVPLGYSLVTVYHTIAAVGTLATTNYSLVLSVSAADNIFPQGMVSLTFDDGWSAQYDNALPILKNANLKGTFFIVSQKMLDANTITADNLLLKINHPDVLISTNSASSTWSNIFTDPTNKSYRFTDFYTSTATSTVDVSYTLNGVATTTNLGILNASPVTPTRASFVFTLPGNPTNTVSPIAITHLTNSGNLVISNPTLTDYDLYMNTSQILEAQAAGIEIGNHTVNHCDLVSGLCPDALIPNSPDPLTSAQEISLAKSTLLSDFPGSSNSLAYPYGSYNTSTQSLVAANGITGARSINAGYNTKFSDKLALSTQVVTAATPLNQVYSWIDNAIQNKWWLILTFHQIENQATITANNDTGAITPEMFTSIVNHLNSSQVKTINESVALMNPTPTSTPVKTPPANFTIIATAGANGTISPIATSTVVSGANQTYTITPNLGFDIATLLIDGVATTTASTYTFTNVSASHTIDTTFSVTPTTTPITTPTSTPVTTPVSSGGGGGSYVPSFVEAINVPLLISPNQSGRAILNLSNGRKLIVNIPVQAVSETINLSISPVQLSPENNFLQRLPSGILIDNTLFNVSATNQSGKIVKDFAKDLVITLDLDPNKDVSKTAVYYYDLANNRWLIIPNGDFSTVSNQVSFSVNHLSLFGLIQSPSLARVINYSPLTPTVTPGVLGVKIYANGSLIRTPDKKIYVIVKGHRVRITSLKQLTKYRGVKIINVAYQDVENIK